ncbi:hypothetical protein [Streptomyces sp. NPDC056242]|uniref:hypothetical protein n=1 Tax=unclassified Streptomyces TaxID=2593676 RepID=UPI0035DBCA29
MIERETAVRIVEEELDRENQQWAARGVAPVPTTVLLARPACPLMAAPRSRVCTQ